MIVTSTRNAQDRWIKDHGIGQQRPPEKSSGEISPKPRGRKHRVHSVEDAYQHDEVLADFLAALHRRPSRSAARKEEVRGNKPEHFSKVEGTAPAQKEEIKFKSEQEEQDEDQPTSIEQEFLDSATDDDAVAISCLQHLSRAIPKIEPPEKIVDDLHSQSLHNRRTRVPMACTRCKMAHTRCDTKRPCGRCVRRGVADSCVDAIPKRRGRKRSDDMEAPLGRSIRPRMDFSSSSSKSSSPKQEYADESPTSYSPPHSWSSRSSAPDEPFRRPRTNSGY
mmetsp:Transcript_20838/g.29132  ORF Transcript_20838/g.29132 Transcript_20838/m.29132 type:complete len:278 (+) Transcript_20838:66-899(+)